MTPCMGPIASAAKLKLRARRERPRGRAGEQDDELSPPHVSRATVWRSLSGWPAAQSGYHGGTS